MGNFVRAVLAILIVGAFLAVGVYALKTLIPEQTRTGLEGAD